LKPKSAIQKGKELEEFIVQRLRLTGLDTRAYRQKGSGSGLNKGDVWNDLNLCFEAKNTAKPNLGPALKQVNREALGTQIPVMVWHMPRTPLDDSKVIIDWSYFEALLGKSKMKESEIENPDRAVAYKLRRFIQYGKDLLKELE
jgi:hypothetical protein